MKYALLVLIWLMWCFLHSALISLMIVWAGDLDVSALVTNLILTGYFIVGTLLEERKLSIEFPEAYKEYQQKVSMFFPYQWLRSKLKD